MATRLIQATIKYVKKELKNAEGGHDWHHINRVYKNALLINKAEGGDELIVGLGALLHDIADSKFHGGDEQIGPEKAADFLRSQGLEGSRINEVVDIVKYISFKGGHNGLKNPSLELKVVQDADRLDALGAIGIARCFNYGGFKNRLIYDPEIKPKKGMTAEEYKSNKGPSINHFYEKLLLLKNLMNTKKGKELAQKRHDFMEDYLSQFYDEWDGNR